MWSVIFFYIAIFLVLIGLLYAQWDLFEKRDITPLLATLILGLVLACSALSNRIGVLEQELKQLKKDKDA